MKSITVDKIHTKYGYEENYWFIDGKSLLEYLNIWSLELCVELKA